MNHEQRIKKLEKQVEQLILIVKAADLDAEFVPLPEAAKRLKVNPWVMRERIRKDDDLELNKQFKMNGSRYLINCQEWQKLIASDVRAKRQ